MSNIQLNANDVAVSLIGPGEFMHTSAVPEGQVAVVLSSVGGHNVYVYGTAQTLRSLVSDGLSAPVPADVPLFDYDRSTATVTPITDASGEVIAVRVQVVEDEQ
jgi:hypothetical protein